MISSSVGALAGAAIGSMTGGVGGAIAGGLAGAAVSNLAGSLVDKGKNLLGLGGSSGLSTFVSIGEMNKVGDWARNYTWNLRFKGGEVPSTFSSWFPATDVSLGLSNIENQDFTAGIGNISVPKSIGSETLSITLLDDYKLQMINWIYKWRKSVVTFKAGYVTPLKDACRECDITVFDSKGANQYTGTYYVFPTGELTFERSSSGDVPQFQVEFAVAGEKDELLSNPSGGGKEANVTRGTNGKLHNNPKVDTSSNANSNGILGNLLN